MQEVLTFLKENPLGSLATVADGKPRVRPWGFMLAEDGKLWFCTANTKDVFRQLQANPAIAFTSFSPDFVTVRLRGDIRFSQDREMKEKILAHSSLVRDIYQTADNPAFEIFYLEHGEAVLADFSGRPPRVFTF